MTPAVGVGTNLGMNTVPGMGMDPTALAGVGMTPGLGLGASSGLAPDMTAAVGLGMSATAAAAAPIATECLLLSNFFDVNKLALFSLWLITCLSTQHFCQTVSFFSLNEEAQLSQRDCAMLCAIEYFAKTHEVIRNDTHE